MPLGHRAMTHTSAESAALCIWERQSIGWILPSLYIRRCQEDHQHALLKVSLSLQHSPSFVNVVRSISPRSTSLDINSLSSALKNGSLSLLDLRICKQSINKSVNANIDGPIILPDRRYACYTGRKPFRSPGPWWSSQDLPEQPRGYIR